MIVEILPSAPDLPREKQVLTSFRVNGSVAVDAGALGLCGEAADQARVRHVFLTHSHADHICSLPVFVENVFDRERPPLLVYGSENTLAALRAHVFNGSIWPDYEKLAAVAGEPPRIRYRALAPGEAVRVEDLEITPVSVNHVVPTFGYLVDDGKAVVAFGGDSGPTAELWRTGNGSGRMRAAFLEATFPDEMIELAGRTGHLTPRLLAEERARIDADADVVAVHIRPRYRRRVEEQLHGHGVPRLRIGQPGRSYRFG